MFLKKSIFFKKSKYLKKKSKSLLDFSKSLLAPGIFFFHIYVKSNKFIACCKNKIVKL